MDVVGTTLSIIGLACKVVQYLSDAKTAGKDMQRLLVEVSMTTGLLTALKTLAETDADWAKTLKSLGEVDKSITIPGENNPPKSPLELMQKLLDKLNRTLAPAKGIRKVGQAVKWPFKKGEAQQDLRTLERLNRIFSFALQHDHVALSREIRDYLTLVLRRVDSIEDRKKIEERKKILRWLTNTDVSRNHTEACNRCEPYTGTWLLESPIFQEWLEGQRKFLWLQGIAGCGKTVLTSSIIETVRSRQIVDHNFGLAYFYFDFNEEGKKVPINALRSIVAQMGICAAGPKGSLPQPIISLYNQLIADGSQPMEKDKLLSTLTELVVGFERSYIVLDALDECGDREESLLPIVSSLINSLPKTCVLVTSRNERDIQQGFEDFPKSIIRVEGDVIEEDIRLFVRNQLKNDPRLRARSPQLRQEIETALVDKAQGMFRWVSCQIDALKSCLNVASLRRALNALPKTLDDIYDRILTNIDEEHSENAFVALQWLTFSARPLHIREIAEAIAVGMRRDCDDIEDHRLFDARDVLTVCSSLIAVSEATSQVRLAHHSVREYLMSERLRIKPVVQMFSISESLANRTIAEACIRYLLLFDENDSLSPNSADEYPLLFYAAKTWFVHAAAVSIEEGEQADLLDLTSSLLGPVECGAFMNWLKIAEPDRPWKIPSLSPGGLPDVGSPLYYASFCGLPSVVKRLLADGAQDRAMGFFGTPVHAASVSGHVSVIELLALHRADLSAKFDGLTPLHRAAQAGHESVVKMLVKLGADLTAQDRSGATPMHTAAARGHTNIVRVFLDAGANPDSRNHNGHSVLRTAVVWRQLEVMQLLINRGADFNEKLNEDTLLHLAASTQNSAVVLKLIEMGTALEAKNASGYTALHLACKSGGGEETVKLLLEHGAFIEAQSIERDTPLHLASHNQGPEVAEILLEHKADVRALNKWNHTPLYCAKFGEWPSVGVADDYKAPMIALLERYGSPLVEARTSPFNARANIPLHGAVKSNNMFQVRHHLDVGDSVNERAIDGSTALHYAVQSCRSFEMASLLLSRGADPNARRSTDGYTPLHLLVSTSYTLDDLVLPIVDLLIQHKAKVTSCAANNQSVVGLAACQNLAQPIKRLIEAGADVNSTFKDTRSALNIASWHAHLETMKVLIDAGANVNIETCGQIPLLEIVCSRGASTDLNRYVEGARMLIDAGADIGYKSGGATVLGRAVYNGNLGLVKLLVRKGADPADQRFPNGQSLVDVALDEGHKEIAKYLEDIGVERD